jgi:cell division protein FtsI (penicillin-binding protein 3)
MPENNNTNFSENIRKQIRRRYTIVLFLFTIPVLIIFVRIAKVQFVEGKEWREFAKKQKKENVEVPPSRGNILSRDGQLMASTVPTYALYLDFQAINPDTFFCYINQLCNKLSEKIGDRSPSEYRQYLMKGYQKRSREYLITKIRVTHSELREIRKFPLFEKGRYQSGLYEKKFFRREKPFGSLASRTIGDIYGEFSKGGKNGLELYYDSILKGSPGLCMRQKVAGKYISVITKNPNDGIDLVTTLDLNFQDIAETALCRELKECNAISGSVVLMKVNTGEVLAISNLAVKDSGTYVESQNFAMADQSEPGSTFKTFSMIVALEDKLVDPDDSFDTGNGAKMMYGRMMMDHNANHGGYHTITAAQSIWYSSNIGVSHFIDKAYHSNPSKFVDGLYRLGFNKPMRLEIPGSGRPRIPHPKDKNRYWAQTDLPWMSIGYVTSIPPIYTLAFYNAIANNGKLMRPYFVKSFSKDGETIKELLPTVLNPKICSDTTLVIIRAMLDSVVTAGTGKPANSPYLRISGKTGTAQISKGAKGYKEGGTSHQVSFCGYFPSDEPKYSCIVVIREPRKGYASGGHMAGTVVRELAERIYACDSRIIPGQQIDSVKVKMPAVIKSGNKGFTKVLLDEYKISANLSEIEKSGWITSTTNDKGIQLKPQEITRKLIPDVRNMGARDAVYLLGNMGLHVNITGRGKVISQSLSPGSLYNKGQNISLILE